MTKKISFMLCSMIVLWMALPLLTTQAKPSLNLAVTRQQFRNEYIKFETIIDALEIRPGMTILDIGSGPGYASFLFAEKLQGRGEVFATDIRKDFVVYIREEAKRRGLKNIFPAIVKEKGLDEFYGRHRYDVVFLSNVYHCLDDRVEYFSKLRGFLKPDARLVLVLYNEVPFFSVDDLSDIDGIISSLSRDTEDSPFIRHLSPRTRQLLKDKASRDNLEENLIDDFNRILIDPGFYKNFYTNFYFKKDFFTPSERDFANWLLMTLNEDGVLEMTADQRDARTTRALVKLNRLFFIKRFGSYLRNEGRGAYIPAGDANRHTSKYVAIRELEAAGYRLSRDITLSPYFNAIIMAPRAP